MSKRAGIILRSFPKEAMNLFPVQAILCILIAAWGAAMIVLGAVWFNLVWLGLGGAVLLVGLPFLRNLLPDRQ